MSRSGIVPGGLSGVLGTVMAFIAAFAWFAAALAGAMMLAIRSLSQQRPSYRRTGMMPRTLQIGFCTRPAGRPAAQRHRSGHRPLTVIAEDRRRHAAGS